MLIPSAQTSNPNQQVWKHGNHQQQKRGKQPLPPLQTALEKVASSQPQIT